MNKQEKQAQKIAKINKQISEYEERTKPSQQLVTTFLEIHSLLRDIILESASFADCQLEIYGSLVNSLFDSECSDMDLTLITTSKANHYEILSKVKKVIDKSRQTSLKIETKDPYWFK